MKVLTGLGDVRENVTGQPLEVRATGRTLVKEGQYGWMDAWWGYKQYFQCTIVNNDVWLI